MSSNIGRDSADADATRAVAPGEQADSTTQRLNDFLAEALPSGCIGAVREILPGDEQFLTAVEALNLDNAVLRVKRSSGSGRFLARQLCARLGFPVSDIPRSSQRYPVWPAGIVGSISHDRQFAAAALAPASLLMGVGIDIEPAEQVSPGVAALVASADELQSFSHLEFPAKALFAIKEAIFKAAYPKDGIFLDFQDVSIDRNKSVAETNYGRIVHWRLLEAPRVLAIAWYER
jgi:4'-phosphopantetheinyl transferase EntD